MNPEQFERDRLAVFAAHGFAGASERYTLADGSETYAIVRRGPAPAGSIPTVVIHGGFAEASVWSLVARYLPGHVVIPDRPGHGLTSSVDYRGLDYRQAAVDWVRQLVDAIGAERVDLVGNSMGGYFAGVFASAHPERVRRVVMVGAPAGLDRELPLFIRLLAKPVIGALIARLRITDPEVLRRRVMAGLVAHPERIPLELLKVKVDSAMRPDRVRVSRSMVRAVCDGRGWRPALSIREDVAALGMPTLFAWGDADSFAPPASGHEVAARMRAGRVEVIAGAGHLPQLDEPEAVGTAIARFLAAADAIVDAAGDRRPALAVAR